MLSSGNVFNCFVSHARILQRDVSKCSATFYQQLMCNHFADIPCFEDTRVHVKDSSGGYDYINATYVDGYRHPKKFIVTQAPMPHTMQQFWAMQWQENDPSRLYDSNVRRTAAADLAPLYSNTDGRRLSCRGHLRRVRWLSTCPRYVRCHGAASDKGGKNASSAMLLPLRRGDKATSRIAEVLQLVADMNYNQELLVERGKKDGWLKEGENSPISINCLAGSGRSCALAAIDIICRRMDDTAQLPSVLRRRRYGAEDAISEGDGCAED